MAVQTLIWPRCPNSTIADPTPDNWIYTQHTPDIMAASKKRTRNGKRKGLTITQLEPSTQTNPQDSDSSSSQEESDIAVVPTNTSPIEADADKASNANTNLHPDLVSQKATPTASQPSNSEDTQRKTTSNI
ncbi:hypothetical protein H4Q26_009950 [Puccinia striiformis f. sp. tritici PST-130]|nr:hypothetical protein H4Q26_009950 [Puccinia striiformis f. sp. tritici PST-130]